MSASTLTRPTDLGNAAPLIKRTLPTVSVIVPCYNEERFIGQTLGNLIAQYPSHIYEIIVVDGMSEDSTRDVVESFQKLHPDVVIRLVLNPDRSIPKSLNLGIEQATGEMIARMDAHAVPSRGYIRRCVEVLSTGNVEVVGMPCLVQAGANTTTARAIALAVSHPFGIGDARYRLGAGKNQQEAVDTVAFACFRRTLWERLGGYDENLLTNEDYDFNYRVRLQGDRVILDRTEHCNYFARESLSKLSAQYRRYGKWKARMIKLHPRSVRVRHLVAPIFVASIILLAALGLWRSEGWLILAAELVLYFSLASLFAAHAVRRANETASVLFILPAVFLVTHLSWGSSFLLGLVGDRVRNVKI
ncbi:MAG TPA: glycosyltransferase family 2 protein [Pyrinomonadaceae bacterium]|nr:glycosyltransferase family 2 protein [Pyrinomonadaceae bacterium]